MKRGKSKRSQSEIIVSILLILIVITSIVIIWAIVSNSVQSSTNKASSESLNIKLEISQVKFFYNGSVEVDLSRGADNGQLTELKFIFYDRNGNTKVISKTETISQKTSRAFFFSQSEIGLDFSNIDKVSVAPVFGENAGIEINEPKPKLDENGNRLMNLYDNLAIPAGSLVSWWKFDGNANDAADGNHGTLENGASISNNVLNLDGTNDYLRVGTVRDNANHNFTSSVWVKIADSTSAWKSIIGEGCDGFDLTVNGARVNYGRNCGRGFGLINSGHDLNVGQWYHIVLTYNQTYLTLYINGEYAHAGAGTFSESGQNMFIGSYNGSNEFFNGAIDNVMIFKKALNKNQISNIYNNQKKNYGY